MTPKPTTHPGKVVLAFSLSQSISIPLLAYKTGIPTPAIRSVIEGRAPIDDLLAERLAKLFTTTDKQFWLDIQAGYNAMMGKEENTIN